MTGMDDPTTEVESQYGVTFEIEGKWASVKGFDTQDDAHEYKQRVLATEAVGAAGVFAHA